MSDNIEGFKTAPLPLALVEKMRKLVVFIKSKNGTCEVDEIFRQVYPVADEFMRVRVNPYASCKCGCSHCCYVPVEITALEAAYISDQIGAPLKFGQSGVTTGPCPFLRNNECSIYQYRPLVCRMFVSLEPPEKCENNDQIHALHGVKSSDFWLLVLGWMAHNSTNITAGSFRLDSAKDIRDWFQNSNKGVPTP